MNNKLVNRAAVVVPLSALAVMSQAQTTGIDWSAMATSAKDDLLATLGIVLPIIAGLLALGVAYRFFVAKFRGAAK